MKVLGMLTLLAIGFIMGCSASKDAATETKEEVKAEATPTPCVPTAETPCPEQK